MCHSDACGHNNPTSIQERALVRKTLLVSPEEAVRGDDHSCGVGEEREDQGVGCHLPLSLGFGSLR